MYSRTWVLGLQEGDDISGHHPDTAPCPAVNVAVSVNMSYCISLSTLETHIPPPRPPSPRPHKTHIMTLVASRLEKEESNIVFLIVYDFQIFIIHS